MAARVEEIVKKWFVLVAGVVSMAGCGSQTAPEALKASDSLEARNLVNATSVFLKKRFWVHINDQNANPWNGNKAMTWAGLEVAKNITLVGGDTTTNAYNGDTSTRTTLPVLCINVNNAPKPDTVQTSFYRGWSFGRILLSTPKRGTALTSLTVANKVCSDQYGQGWRMAEFHDGFHNGSRGGWGFYALSSFMTLSPRQAAWDESVTATLYGVDPDMVSLSLENVSIKIDSKTGNQIKFTVPKNTEGGPKNVVVASGANDAKESLFVYGQASRDENGNQSDELTVVVDPGQTEAQIKARVESLGFIYVDGSLQSLTNSANPTQQGPCGFSTIRIRTNGKPVGASIETLLNQGNSNGVLFYDANPITTWVVRQATPKTITLMEADHKPEIGLANAHARGQKGAGVTIAVLDTGVNPNEALGDRLTRIRLPGFTDDNDVALNPDGHGTATAVLAAGGAYQNTLGVAPEAKVMSVRTCDSNNRCSAENVTRAICYVMAQPGIDPKKLVYNLSLGGDTPNTYLKTVMDYAVSRGALFAAAAGNGADPIKNINGAKNYPASEQIDGLISVGASYSPNLAQDGPITELQPLPVTLDRTGDTDALNDGDDIAYGEFSDLIMDIGSPKEVKQFQIKAVRAAWIILAPYHRFEIEYSTSNSPYNWQKTKLRKSGSTDLYSDFGEYRYYGNEQFKFDFEIPFTTRYVRYKLTYSPYVWSPSPGVNYLSGLVAELQLTGKSWRPAPFSTRNSSVEITAPGVGIISVSSSGVAKAFTGTSFSTPLVAGALALWRSAYPDWTPAQIEAALRAKAKKLPYDAAAVGSGMLNVENIHLP